MHTIRLRFVALFMVATTLTLALFGIYAQQLLSSELEQRFESVQTETLQRLRLSTVQPVWDFNALEIQNVLLAEIQPLEVAAIQVLDAKGKVFAAIARDASGQAVAGLVPSSTSSIRRTTDLFRENTLTGNVKDSVVNIRIGQVVVDFSRARIDQALASDTLRRIVEIIVIDAVLLLALAFSLRTVFTPLAALRDALFSLAQQDDEEVRELPEDKRNEFGEVIKGFNLTQRKLKGVMQRRRVSEEALRHAVEKTEAAYAELQSTQAALIQSERLASLGGLVAGVAHEINTPIGVALTSASVLNEGTTQLRDSIEGGSIRKSEVMAYLNMAEEASRLILTNAQRAAQLIHSFKQVAVDQTSEMRREYELGGYLQEVVSSLRPTIKQGHGQVSIHCPSPVLVEGLPGAMAQVLTNLIMNALTHAFEPGVGGQIDIHVSSAGDTVTLSLSDNGRGIPSEDISKVFDPFFTTRRGRGGTGLGLNIVYNIVTSRFAGSIEVSSTVGTGTTFTMRFPRVLPPSTNKPA
ncbi:sensor histidine kinase [Rhodoferax aquaticus]|uniref:histidine kinase n=1 Tax=Rhodoferax aquaticus TaxID=2527691 RepID=A0A515ES35_9BURK|nr:ATP-binding protein [Rhodoferax aquaticus]QDL55448.1 HAMP domain-containing histidine kinase [Rhodoferax aquaticus]